MKLIKQSLLQGLKKIADQESQCNGSLTADTCIHRHVNNILPLQKHVTHEDAWSHKRENCDM